MRLPIFDRRPLECSQRQTPSCPKGKPFGAKIAVAVRMAHESELDDLRGICNFEASLVDLQRPDLRLQSGSRYTEFGRGAGGPVHSASAFAQRGLDNRFLLGGKPLK